MTRLLPVLCAAILALPALPTPAPAQDCLDYGLYPRLLGQTDDPYSAVRIAVSGDLAVIAREYAEAAVLDVSDPAQPTPLAEFADRAFGVAMAGEHAYLLTAGHTIQAQDLSEPGAPVLRSEVATGLRMDHAAVAGELLYVLGTELEDGSPSELLILDIADPGELVPLASVAMPGRGGTIEVAGGRLHYLQDGALHVFALGDPLQPQHLGMVDLGAGAYYLAGDGSLLVASGPSGLRVIDATVPGEPVVVGVLGVAGLCYDLALRDGVVYLANWGDGLTLIDVADPATPALIATTHLGEGARAVVLSGDVALVAGHRVFAIDVSRPQAPPAVGALPLASRAGRMAARGDLVYWFDADRGFHVADLGDPAQPVLLGSLTLQGRPTDLVLDGDLVYVAAGDDTVFEVIDIADPENPEAVGVVPTGGNLGSLQAAIQAGHLYLVRFYQGTFYTIDQLLVYAIDDPANPVLTATIDLAERSRTIALVGDLAYIGGGEGELQIFDLGVPGQPQLLHTLDISGIHGRTVVAGDLLISGHLDGVSVFSVADPLQPHLLGHAELPWVRDLELRGNLVYVAGLADGLAILDVEDPAAPRWAGRANLPDDCDALALVGGHVAVAAAGGLQVFLPHCPGTVAVEPPDGDGGGTATVPAPPAALALAAHPNPFNPTTTIGFAIAVAGHARLQVLDLRGRLVATLVDEPLAAGHHAATWTGRDAAGREVPSGVYLCRLESGGRVVHGRMTLVR